MACLVGDLEGGECVWDLFVREKSVWVIWLVFR